MPDRRPRYVVDEADPRAPTQEAWDGMTADERAEVLASLPSDIPPTEAAPPEGEVHFDAVVRARDVLRGFFRRSGRRVWVGNNLAVYYPGERMFSPDVIAVCDVDARERDHYTVSAEGKGLDVVIEILWHGRRRKDLIDNVGWFARLGIPEYFIFDRRRLRLHGHRLPGPGARAYQPILPQLGAYRSEQLGLELAIEGDKLRFSFAGAPLPESEELIARLDANLRAAEQHAEEEALRAEEEARRAEGEAQRAEEAERRLAEALAELERLRTR
jgi:Uma2 family endonuclease